jgi:hypothetical protein
MELTIAILDMEIPKILKIINTSIVFFDIFLLEYICHIGGFIVTVPNRLTLYIG